MTVFISKGLNQPLDTTYFEKGLMLLIEKNFPIPSDFTIISERRKYKVKEDESLWKQNIHKLPEVADIYYKNTFLCDVSEAMLPEMVLKKIKDCLKFKNRSPDKKNVLTAS